MHKPSPPLISRVIDNDLCIACGACISACPKNNIQPVFNHFNGAPEVAITASEQCMGCSKPCDQVCPSISIDFVKLKATLRFNDTFAQKPSRDGWMQSVHLAWSPSYRDDGVSSSGGVIRAMVANSLEVGTPVICLALDPADNALKPRLLSQIDDLSYVPGSIYHSTSFIGAIELIRQAPKPVMLVAIPCQLTGILQYIANCERDLADKIETVCGIVCGWMYSHHALEAFAQFKKLPGKIVDARYRGGDRVGKLKVFARNHEFTYDRRNFENLSDAIDYQASFSTDYNRLRCRVCEDHLNLLADVVAGDAWLERTKTQKISVLGIRTERGYKVIDRLAQSKRIILETATFDDFIESQSNNLVYGDTARKINRQLQQKSGIAPQYMFADSENRVALNVLERFAFKVEMIRRSLVRNQLFALYRTLYVVRRLRMVVRVIVKKIIKR